MTTMQHLEIQEGATWSWTYTHSADLTGYSARMSIRRDWRSDPVAYLSTGSDADGGSISISGAAVTLSMTALQTANLLESENLIDALVSQRRDYKRFEQFIYDLETVTGATVTRVLQGNVVVEREATTA